jgi:HlyD family secretion protein
VGQAATVTVDAYPNRPFDGTVLKIEPQAQTEQNVTVFPVLVRIQNREGLLRPGMNTEVEIHVGRRDSVLAVPNAALRTQRDVASAAQVLGIAPETVQRELAATAPASGNRSEGASSGSDGVPPQRPDSLRTERDSGRTRSAERARSDSGQQRMGAAWRQDRGGAGRRQGGFGGGAAGRYIVFVKRNGQPKPVWIRTGLTDLDYSEVTQGLDRGDSVYVLPSASLVQSQQDMKQRFTQMTGGGGVPGMRAQTSTPPGGGAAAGGSPPR